MKTLIKLFLIGCLLQPLLTRAGYGDNSFFVTLDPGTTNVTDEALEDARTNIDCQPAGVDKKGHWGGVITGLQLGLSFPKSKFRVDEPVIATIIYRNTRKDYRMPCHWRYGGDLDFGFVIRDANGNRLADSFQPYPAFEKTNVWWTPGTQYIYQSDLTQRFGLSNPGTYTVEVCRRLPNPAYKTEAILFSSKATITISE